MRRKVVYSPAARELADYLASDEYRSSVARARAERVALAPPAGGWITMDRIPDGDVPAAGRVKPHG